jgi:hypothetical protein
MGSPAGIAAGPDGKIWLGGQTANVARIDPATMNEEAVSDIALTGFNVRNLAPGPDGNVWVTDFGGNIARVTPAGLATPFDIPGDGAWDIVTGPDGNLWYTAPEGNNSYVGRITPAGVAGPQYETTDAGDQLGITVGPDGALWFAQAVANDIGRMTLDGNFTQVGGLSAAARPEYIAPGPANTLWFTATATAASARHHAPRRHSLPHHASGVPARWARHGHQVEAVGGCQEHDRVPPARQRPLAAGAAPQNALPGHGRRPPAALPRARQPQEAASAGPLQDDHDRPRCGGQRLAPGSRALQAAAAPAPLDLRHRVLRRAAGIRSRRGWRGVRRRRLGAGRGAGAWAGRFGVHLSSLPG